MDKENPNISTELSISNKDLLVENLNSLKKLSLNLPKETNLPTVPTDGWFLGIGDHNVTGNELNNLTENIQNRMIDTNRSIINVVEQLAIVYDTFSKLDEVYVKGYYSAIMTAFRAIEEVQLANERIRNQQGDINGTQQDIRQVINQQKQIIQVLKKFKEKLEKLTHLYDIDDTFNEVCALQAKIESLKQISVEYKSYIENIVEVQTNFSGSFEILNSSIDVISEDTQKLSDAVGKLKTLSSDLEKTVAQSKKDQANTTKMLENIEIQQKNFEKSFGIQKLNMEHLSATQQEFLSLLISAKKTVDKLSEKLAQAEQKADQRFSEIKRSTEKQNADYAQKCSSFENEIKKCEEASQEFNSVINLEMKQINDNAGKQYKTIQSELIDFRSENSTLLKSLLVVKCISISSLALSFVLLILMLTGVLK